ncbi:hypothetical protein D0Z03_001401 [Geotrichum reessii]|nr:hypothetical protein D0Z03_001401 [Galactomyces reessii]
MIPTPTTRTLDITKVYEPYEDSFLFLDLLEQEKPYLTTRYTASPVVLEIGTGSGIIATFINAHILPQSITLATDINSHACRAFNATMQENADACHAGRGMDVVRASLASAIRQQAVDLLVFNPPYVPEETVPRMPAADDDADDGWLDLALVGGKDGMEVTWALLDDLDSVLNPDRGCAMILFCKRNKPEEVAKTMEARGWKAVLVGERKAGWEVLSIWRFSRN